MVVPLIMLPLLQYERHLPFVVMGVCAALAAVHSSPQPFAPSQFSLVPSTSTLVFHLATLTGGLHAQMIALVCAAEPAKALQDVVQVQTPRTRTDQWAKAHGESDLLYPGSALSDLSRRVSVMACRTCGRHITSWD